MFVKERREVGVISTGRGQECHLCIPTQQLLMQTGQCQNRVNLKGENPHIECVNNLVATSCTDAIPVCQPQFVAVSALESMQGRSGTINYHSQIQLATVVVFHSINVHYWLPPHTRASNV